MTDSKKERRDYFRIEDTIGLRYSILGEGGDAAFRERSNADLPLANLLAEIDVEFNQAENTLWNENATIAQALGLLNRKISVLASHQLQQQGQPADPYQELLASISGCGLGFPCAEAIPAGSRLRVSVVLKPSNIVVHFTARVVGCDELADNDAGSYWMRLSIDENSRAAREQLVQHVVQRQRVQVDGKGPTKA